VHRRTPNLVPDRLDHREQLRRLLALQHDAVGRLELDVEGSQDCTEEGEDRNQHPGRAERLVTRHDDDGHDEREEGDQHARDEPVPERRECDDPPPVGCRIRPRRGLQPPHQLLPGRLLHVRDP
jgi:hypothetical protein